MHRGDAEVAVASRVAAVIGLFFRDATAADADAIAGLHAASWRATYRGIVTDEFLEKAALENLLALWRNRFSPEHAREQWVRVAIERQALAGFACVSTAAEPDWGFFLDSLHVRPDAKGRGIGRRLIAEAAAFALLQSPDATMHLWVFERNTAARRFYDQLGGAVAEHKTGRTPDGGEAAVVRYVWRDLSVLV